MQSASRGSHHSITTGASSIGRGSSGASTTACLDLLHRLPLLQALRGTPHVVLLPPLRRARRCLRRRHVLRRCAVAAEALGAMGHHALALCTLFRSLHQ